MTTTLERKTQHGYLVLADISGFTSYLVGVELDHAEEILTDLLELIVNQFRPLLTIGKLEGDAVFAYVPESKVPRGETLLELLEATYAAFKNRVDLIRRRTTCECKACRAIPTLDLKFVVHYGRYIVQNVAGINELVGSDVNLVHRLLKNHVSEATEWRAYALFTEACLLQMCVRPEAMHVQVEAYEHLGEVKTYSLNLHDRYKAMLEARRVFLTAEEADVVMSVKIPAPPAVVWSWLNDPLKRSQWMEGATWSAEARPGGRTAAGARNHCAHGRSISREDIVDWRPFDYYTSELAPNPKSATRIVMTYHLAPAAGGSTNLNLHLLLRIPSLPRWLTRPLCRVMARLFRMQKDQAALARLVAEETRGEREVETFPILATA